MARSLGKHVSASLCGRGLVSGCYWDIQSSNTVYIYYNIVYSTVTEASYLVKAGWDRSFDFPPEGRALRNLGGTRSSLKLRGGHALLQKFKSSTCHLQAGTSVGSLAILGS